MLALLLLLSELCLLLGLLLLRRGLHQAPSLACLLVARLLLGLLLSLLLPAHLLLLRDLLLLAGLVLGLLLLLHGLLALSLFLLPLLGLLLGSRLLLLLLSLRERGLLLDALLLLLLLCLLRLLSLLLGEEGPLLLLLHLLHRARVRREIGRRSRGQYAARSGIVVVDVDVAHVVDHGGRARDVGAVVVDHRRPCEGRLRAGATVAIAPARRVCRRSDPRQTRRIALSSPSRAAGRYV